MKKRHVAALLAGATALLVPTPSPARADSPWDPAVTVTPSTNLTDGQLVSIAGSGFQQQGIMVAECGGETVFGPHPICTYYTAPVSHLETDADGSFAINFPVAASYDGTQYIKQPHRSDPAPAHYDCLPANDCFLRVQTTTQKWTRIDVPITFAQ